MEEKMFYLLDCPITLEEAKKIYIEYVVSQDQYIKTVDESILTIEETFYLHSFIEGKVVDQDYLIVKGDITKSGLIDMENTTFSKDFLLEGLDRNHNIVAIESLDEIKVENENELENCMHRFLSGLQNKMETAICARHHLVLTERQNKLDIAPIRSFYRFDWRVYLEKVFVFRYRLSGVKKDYVALLSAQTGRFKTICFPPSEAFNNFIKRFKRPIVYIPNYLKDYYYQIAFSIYEQTMEELKYTTEVELQKKIKTNLSYKGYSKYKDYLFQGIFFFKQKKLLASYPIEETKDIKKMIFQYFLTLNYQSESGMHLAEYYKMEILEENDIKDFLHFVTVSFRLGNISAKKILYEHFNHPRYYNSYFLRRYS